MLVDEMTLRDYFAAQVANAMIANPAAAERVSKLSYAHGIDQVRLGALAAYVQADEMMKARELPNPAFELGKLCS